MAVDFIRLNDPVQDLGQLNRFIQQVVDEFNQQHVTRPGAKALATGGNVTNIGGRGRGGHIIQDERVTLPNRTFLNFTGCGVTATDNLLLDTTDVTIPFGGVKELFRDYTILPEDEGKLLVTNIGGNYTAYWGNAAPRSGSTFTNVNGGIDGDPLTYTSLSRVTYSLSDDNWWEAKFVAGTPFTADDGNVTVSVTLETFKSGASPDQFRAFAIMPTSNIRHTDYPYDSTLIAYPDNTAYSKQTFTHVFDQTARTAYGLGDTWILHAENIGGFLSFDTVNTIRVYEYTVTCATRTNTLTLPATPPSDCWKVFIENISTQPLTLARNGRLIDTAASDLSIGQNEGVVVFTDGTNYFTERGMGNTTTPVISTSANTRMVNFTIDGGGATISTGVAGAIQIPFAATITGWSIEETTGHSGSISIDVCKAAGTQAVPGIPDTSTDIISASAPIALSSAISAGVGASSLTGWTTAVTQWDSILFNVTSATTVQRVNGWLSLETT